MAEVELSIGGRAYRLACRDGEEEDLRAAAGLLDSRVTALMQAHGAIAEPRLLLMASLLISGELLERKAEDARQSVRTLVPARPAAPDPLYDALATRAEALADQLEEVLQAS
jgi:cell division protein ZapA